MATVAGSTVGIVQAARSVGLTAIVVGAMLVERLGVVTMLGDLVDVVSPSATVTRTTRCIGGSQAARLGSLSGAISFANTSAWSSATTV